jgi:hypothetical protein
VNELRQRYAIPIRRMDAFLLSKDAPANRATNSSFRNSSPKQLRCPTCQELCTSSSMTVEHIHPLNLGGTNDSSNLVMMCQPCNSARDHVVTKVFGTTNLSSLRSRWSLIREQGFDVLVWLHITAEKGGEGWGAFPTFDAAFRNQRQLETLPEDEFSGGFQSPPSSGEGWFGRTSRYLRSLREALREQPSNRSSMKVPFECGCGQHVGVPSNYVGRFACPSCNSPAHRNVDGSFKVEGLSLPTDEDTMKRQELAKEVLQGLVRSSHPVPYIREEFYAWACKEFDTQTRMEARAAIGVKKSLSFFLFAKRLLSPRDLEVLESKYADGNTESQNTAANDNTSSQDEPCEKGELPLDATESNQAKKHLLNATVDFFQTNIPDDPEWINGSALGMRLSGFLTEEGLDGRSELNTLLGLESGSSLEDLVDHCLGSYASSRWPEKTIVEFQRSRAGEGAQNTESALHRDEPNLLNEGDFSGDGDDTDRTFLPNVKVGSVETIDRMCEFSLQSEVIQKFEFDEAVRRQIQSYFSHVKARLQGNPESSEEWHTIPNFSTASRGIRFPAHPDELYDALVFIQDHKNRQNMNELMNMMKSTSVIQSKSRVLRIFLVLVKVYSDE